MQGLLQLSYTNRHHKLKTGLNNPGLQQLCLLEFCAGVLWILFAEPTPASKGLQSMLRCDS